MTNFPKILIIYIKRNCKAFLASFSVYMQMRTINNFTIWILVRSSWPNVKAKQGNITLSIPSIKRNFTAAPILSVYTDDELVTAHNTHNINI